MQRCLLLNTTTTCTESHLPRGWTTARPDTTGVTVKTGGRWIHRERTDARGDQRQRRRQPGPGTISLNQDVSRHEHRLARRLHEGPAAQLVAASDNSRRQRRSRNVQTCRHAAECSGRYRARRSGPGSRSVADRRPGRELGSEVMRARGTPVRARTTSWSRSASAGRSQLSGPTDPPLLRASEQARETSSAAGDAALRSMAEPGQGCTGPFAVNTSDPTCAAAGDQPVSTA